MFEEGEGTVARLNNRIVERDRRIAELEAELKGTVEALIPPNRDKCGTCRHSLVWQYAHGQDADMTGPTSLVCPRCVLARAKKAEARLAAITMMVHEGSEKATEEAHHAKGEAFCYWQGEQSVWAKLNCALADNDVRG